MSRSVLLCSASVIIAMLLSACGGPPTTAAPPPTSAPAFENSPEGVVRKILDAIERQDANQYLDALDPDLRSQPSYFFASALVRGVQSYLGLEGAGDLNEVAFRDLQYASSLINETTASVNVAGKIRNLALATESDFAGAFFVRNIDGIWHVSDPNTGLAQVTHAPDGPIWNVLPVSIEAAEPSRGWIYYHVILAIENHGSQLGLAQIDMGPGTVETQEGFTYPIDPLVLTTDFEVPPEFRTTGLFGSRTYDLWFEAAETARVSKVNFANYGIMDLENVPTVRVSGESYDWYVTNYDAVQSLGFPTSRPNADFSNLGEPIEIPGAARITLGQAHRVGPTANGDPGNEGLFIDVEVENLNQGYDITVQSDCYLMDGLGLIRLDKADQGWGYGAGPGQTIKATINFEFPDAEDQDNETDVELLQMILTNPKLLCRGDFQGIFNIELQ